MSLRGNGLEWPRLLPDVGVFCGVVADSSPPAEEDFRPFFRTALASLPVEGTPSDEAGESNGGGGG